MIVIGIDPDVDRSGVAIVDKAAHRIETYALSFPLLIEKLREVFLLYGNKVLVRVEAGWLNKSHWHIQRGSNSFLSAKIGNSTGRNHQVGLLIVQMAEYIGLRVELQKPLRKVWKGQGGKISQSEIERLTGYSERMSQDVRDALLIAWL